MTWKNKMGVYWELKLCVCEDWHSLSDVLQQPALEHPAYLSDQETFIY